MDKSKIVVLDLKGVTWPSGLSMDYSLSTIVSFFNYTRRSKGLSEKPSYLVVEDNKPYYEEVKALIEKYEASEIGECSFSVD